MGKIPAERLDLFDKATFAHVTTMNPNGKPHTTPVWIDYDSEADQLLVNTERDRQKTRNAERNPSAAVSMIDPENAYRFLSVTGEVSEVTTENAREHIDTLAERYMGESEYPNPIESERVILRIEPEDVRAGG